METIQGQHLNSMTETGRVQSRRDSHLGPRGLALRPHASCLGVQCTKDKSSVPLIIGKSSEVVNETSPCDCSQKHQRHTLLNQRSSVLLTS